MELTTNGVTITLPSGRVVEKHEVSVADCKDLAKEEGLKKFNVNLNDVPTKGSDFPITEGSVTITPYNEAK